MNRALFSITIFILGVFFAASVKSQPSFPVFFDFKLYDSSGKPVDYERFCKEFKFLRGDGTDDQTPCSNENINQAYFYNDTTMLFSTSGSVVYNDLRRKMIHGADTMILIFRSNTLRRTHKVDSLIVKPGGYIIEDEHLHHIDYCKSGALYYCYILAQAMDCKQQLSDERYRQTVFYIELCRLKKMYGIPFDDFEEKTSNDLCK